MKILAVHNYYGSAAPSGENAAFDAEVDMMRRRGNTVLTLTRDSDDIRRNRVLGALRGGISVPWNPCAAAAARRLVAREQPQVMHVHNTFPLISPAVFRAARGTQTATVLTLHNYRLFCAKGVPLRGGIPCVRCLADQSVLPALRHGCYRGSRACTFPLALSILLHRWLGTWCSDVDGFIALTAFQASTMAAAGLPSPRIHVKPHFYAAAPDPVPWEQREPLVVYLGRLSEEKGTQVLVEAWGMWGRAAPSLLIMGDGPARGDLEGRARAYPQRGCVRFTGQLAHSEAMAMLRRARLVVVPSLCYEGFPMAIREAYAHGVPVAGSRVGAIASLVVEGTSGVMFCPNDPVDLLSVVRGLWSDPARLQRLGSGARELFDAEYTEERNYDLLLGVYQQALAARGTRATARHGRRSRL